MAPGLSDRDPRKKERRTTIKTFRLPEELLLALEKDAEDEGTTLNALVSTVLARYAEWGSLAKKLGVISVSKGVLTAALDAADEDSLGVASRKTVPTAWKDMTVFRFHELTVDNLIQLWRLITKYGYPADLDVHKDGKEYLLSFRHDLGPKFSVLLANAFDETIRTLFHIQPTVESGDALITVRFTEPDAPSFS